MWDYQKTTNWISYLIRHSSHTFIIASVRFAVAVLLQSEIPPTTLQLFRLILNFMTLKEFFLFYYRHHYFPNINTRTFFSSCCALFRVKNDYILSFIFFFYMCACINLIHISHRQFSISSHSIEINLFVKLIFEMSQCLSYCTSKKSFSILIFNFIFILFLCCTLRNC